MILETVVGFVGGFIGNGISAFANYKMKQLEAEENRFKREHELNMVKAESEARLAEVAAHIQVAQVQTEGAISLEEARAFTKSQEVGNEKVFETRWVTTLLNRKDGWRFVTVPIAVFICTLFGISDAIQTLMRPTLTLYSGVIATWVTWRSWDVLQAAGLDTLTVSHALAQWETAVSVVYTLTLTLFTWWFGDRRLAKNLALQQQHAAKGVA